MIAIAMDSNDRPCIAYADKEQLRFARKRGDGWDIARVAEPRGEDAVLGQLASLGLDADNRPHIAYYELPDNAQSSTGTVYYAMGSGPTSVSETVAVPHSYRLYPNVPNPFNPSTEIGFALAAPGQARLAVYNLLGQEVRLLQSGWLDAGEYHVTWDGTDADGNEVGSGVYLALMRFRAQAKMRKMLHCVSARRQTTMLVSPSSRGARATIQGPTI